MEAWSWRPFFVCEDLEPVEVRGGRRDVVWGLGVGEKTCSRVMDVLELL